MEGSFIIITGRDPNVKDRRHLWCNVQNSNTNVNCCNRTGTSTITTNDNDHRTESIHTKYEVNNNKKSTKVKSDLG